MIKVVYAEGCSFTAGAELKDWKMTDEGLEHSESTWAAQIQKLCFPNAKYFPTARSASSNSHIRRRALYYLSELLKDYKGKEIVFLVQWTDINRREFRVPKIQNTKRYGTYNDKEEQLYISLLPIDVLGTFFSNPIVQQVDRNRWLESNNIIKLFHEYNKHIMCRESSMYDSLSEIEQVRNFCKLHKIKIYETIGFGELVGAYGKLQTQDKFLLDLANKVDIENTSFFVKDDLPEGFHDYNKRVGLKFGPGGHPLEGAHRTWSRMMMKHFNLQKVKND
jgi:hypothetical protein